MSTQQYAGFWLRFVAVIIDGIIIGIVQMIVITPILGVLGFGMANEIQNLEPGNEAQAMGMVGAIMATMGLVYLVTTIITILYFALMESSKLQATVGKLALGLKVTDTAGNPTSFGKAFVRNLCRLISSAVFFIGYIIAGFTEKKQALHDIIAGTLVVKK